MDRLILQRHGKAEGDSASGQDFDRALTERGRRDALLTAQALAASGVRPDLVLVSPAARTIQTWDAAAAVFPDAEVRSVPMLYDIGSQAMLNLARDEGASVGTVMVVGHNPGLGALAVHLAAQAGAGADLLGRIGMNFPTGAAAVIGFEPPSFALHTPKDLRGPGRVYKIASREAWDAATAQGRFDGAPIDLKDGYIHLSTGAQAQETARLHFHGQSGLVLAAFDAEALGPGLKWEPSRGGQLFPHLYGPLDPALALTVADIALDADGVPQLGLGPA
jgi:phosphohistidine phosphatase